MNQSDTLQIVCPRRHRFMPLVVACLGMILLVPGLPKMWARVPEFTACLSLVVMLAMLLMMAAILYRNLLFRDQLWIVRGEGQPGQRLNCFAHEIVSLYRRSRGSPYSSEGKWEALGLDQGLIEIRTTRGCFRFSVGLNEKAADAATRRIAVFCGLQVAPDEDGWVRPGARPDALSQCNDEA